MVRSKPGLINCFRLAGVVKILETLAIFTCLMMHRIGAIGTQVCHFIIGVVDRKLKIPFIVLL